jgi:hypothetical protein
MCNNQKAWYLVFWRALLLFSLASLFTNSTLPAQTPMSMPELKSSLILISTKLSKENASLQSDLSQSKKDSTQLRIKVLSSQTELAQAIAERNEKENSLINLKNSSENFQKKADARIHSLERQRIYIIGGSIAAMVLTVYLVKKT